MILQIEDLQVYQLAMARGEKVLLLCTGSLYETRTWLTKGNNRKLINDDDFNSLNEDIESIGKKLNAYIKSIGKEPIVQ